MHVRLLLFLWAFLCLNFSNVSAREINKSAFLKFYQKQVDKDTAAIDSTNRPLLGTRKNTDSIYSDISLVNVVTSPARLSELPVVSLQQYLKGNAPGLQIQEPSGEPGTVQQMFMRGISAPLLSVREALQQQPLVVLDGVPLIGEHPFAYDIQLYKYNRIGTATNLLANIDMNNIADIKILRDLAATAVYGPMGANGVIALTSKQPVSGRRIGFSTYFGMAQRPGVTTLNASYENAFRKQFYNRYTATGRYSDEDVYPSYLSDSSSVLYNGPSNWSDLYYSNGMVHGITADLSGGTERANFRFSAGNTRNQGIADSTGLDRYNVMFNINMKPLKWLTFSVMANANRLERDRNRSLRDRFGQTGYLPSLAGPLTPNKEMYQQYLGQFGKGFDDNINNILEGYGKLSIDLKDFEISSRVSVDYNEGTRDIFFGRPLMEGNSYASNYFGYNQRLIFENSVSYIKQLGNDHNIKAVFGQSLQWDLSKYNYAYGYRGVNDFIKLNLLNTDPNSSSYLAPNSFPINLVYKFLDKTRQNLSSFYGRGSYNYKNKYTFSAILRADASSNEQPTSRWFFSPVVSAGWDVKNDLLTSNSAISALNLRLSAGRLGKLNTFDNYAQGPQYTAEIGYTGNPTLPGYNAFSVLTRPYNYGWVGYNIPWAYTDQLNFGIDFGFQSNRMQGSLDLYSKTDKNQILSIPAYAEYGYKQSLEAGMDVNNTGAELTLRYEVFQAQTSKLSWTPAINLSYNVNKLKALPNGLKEIIIDNRLFQVGKPIDQYWLLSNNGIYTSDSEIPVVNGKPLQYNGTPLAAGDPRWQDQNNDNIINNNDKTLQGHSLPVVIGGFNNDINYGKWSVNLNFYFNIGRSLLNQEMANSLDFINREGGNTIESVKEITFWEKRGNRNDYPLYNPWSGVIPYRIDQNLFLENASFVKLRTVSVGYDLTSVLKNKMKINRLYVYATANNLFTITKYTGQDPELVGYNGYDTGYGMPIPKTYTLGLKMDL